MHKLTTKRQVTIPQSICSKLGLEPGDFIQVFERDGVAHLVKMTMDDMAGTVTPLAQQRSNIEDSQDTTDVKQSIKNKAARKFRGEE